MRRQAHLRAAGLAAVVSSGLLLAACGGSLSGAATSPATPSAPASSPPAARSARPAPGGVFGHPLLSPQVTVTPGAIYVAWQVSPPGSTVRSELARVDPASGQVEAARPLGAAFGQAIAAGGRAMGDDLDDDRRKLLRLNPESLRLTGRWRAGRGGGQRLAQVLAVAGAGSGRRAGTGCCTCPFPVAASWTRSFCPGRPARTCRQCRRDRPDRGEADAAARRRPAADPGTGAILASRPMTGVTAPIVEGPIGSAVWVSEATGMMGYVQRLDAGTLAPAAGPAWPEAAG